MTLDREIKGWCPGAYRPMMSGDGLIVRIRPRLGHMTAAQALGLCAVSQSHGNGIIDLTSRANLQLRGVSDGTHDTVLNDLLTLDLLDHTPKAEDRRNIVTTPDWQNGDINHRLHDAICARLDDLPSLPGKVGIAVDAGPAPLLQDTSADFRFESGADDALILRADGCTLGRAIPEKDAVDALIELANWLAAQIDPKIRRMAKTNAHTQLPQNWRSTPMRAAGAKLTPSAPHHIYGAPFGSMDAAALTALIQDSNATAMRVTPWRLFALEQAQSCAAHGFITAKDDPLLRTHACPGAPACASATVDTRTLARSLAPFHSDLHVSGCPKGCANPRPASTTLVGRMGAYDLVKQGHPWDQPCQRGLSPNDLMTIKA